MVKALEEKPHEELLSSLGLFSLEETEGRLSAVYNFLVRGREGTGTLVTSDRTQGNGMKLTYEAVSPAMMPGQIPDPSLTAGALPGLGPLTGLPGTALTAEELKCADIRNIGAMISPLQFLEVKLGKRPQPVKSELDEEEERRKRRREKNKVAAARCRNKKKERTEFLQRESERLELMNAELKAQIEELKQERQQLILMLNRHRPTCIVRTDSIKTPESEANPLLEQLEKK
ncbi:Jun dimerization protein 2 [Turdus rufiventris]|nr:Jun dimerization protein 2 [Turdus rufiventris]